MDRRRGSSLHPRRPQSPRAAHGSRRVRAAGSRQVNLAIVPDEPPECLRRLTRWLLWRLEPSPGGRPTKVPDQSTSDLRRCRTFDEVRREPLSSEGGIGFVVTDTVVLKKNDGTPVTILLLDLDACRNPTTGEIAPWALGAIEACNRSYTEVSPSGTGLRIAVAVVSPPRDVRSKVDVPHPAPLGATKKPNIQIFGLGPAAYTTVTGQRLADTSPKVAAIDSLDAIVDLFGMRETKAASPLVALGSMAGDGTVPTMEEITASVLQHAKGRELIDAKWMKVTPNKSASEAYYLLVQEAHKAARGHGDATLKWLLTKTAWGIGCVENSNDPEKYRRESWVGKEVQRAAFKAPRTPIQDSFKDLGPAPAADGPAPPNTTEPRMGKMFVDFAMRHAELQTLADDGVLVPGLLGRGRITNVAAGPKTGKSTLLIAMLAGFALPVPREFPGFGVPAKQLRVLYLSENHPDDDAVLFEALGEAASMLHGIDRREIPPKTMETWGTFLAYVAKLVVYGNYEVVVLDSFEAWVPDLEDGNAGAQVAHRYGALSRVVAQARNVAVICVLHTKKDAGPTLSFDDILGSTKYRASSDFNIMLARVSPDDPHDTRIVMRREGRDPFALIRSVCGRLPNSVASAIRNRSPAGPARLCYRLRGEILLDTSGRERASIRYEACDVPQEWATKTSRSAKLSKHQVEQLDEDVLLAAVRLRTEEVGSKVVSARKLVEDGYVARAAARMGLPANYTPPGDRKVRGAQARLVEAKRLIRHNGGGVTLGLDPPGFTPMPGEAG